MVSKVQPCSSVWSGCVVICEKIKELTLRIAKAVRGFFESLFCCKKRKAINESSGSVTYSSLQGGSIGKIENDGTIGASLDEGHRQNQGLLDPPGAKPEIGQAREVENLFSLTPRREDSERVGGSSDSLPGLVFSPTQREQLVEQLKAGLTSTSTLSTESGGSVEKGLDTEHRKNQELSELYWKDQRSRIGQFKVLTQLDEPSTELSECPLACPFVCFQAAEVFYKNFQKRNPIDIDTAIQKGIEQQKSTGACSIEEILQQNKSLKEHKDTLDATYPFRERLLRQITEVGLEAKSNRFQRALLKIEEEYFLVLATSESGLLSQFYVLDLQMALEDKRSRFLEFETAAGARNYFLSRNKDLENQQYQMFWWSHSLASNPLRSGDVNP